MGASTIDGQLVDEARLGYDFPMDEVLGLPIFHCSNRIEHHTQNCSAGWLLLAVIVKPVQICILSTYIHTQEKHQTTRHSSNPSIPHITSHARKGHSRIKRTLILSIH